MAPTYIDLDTLKLQLGIPTSDATSDSLLTKGLNAACRLIDDATGRRFYADGSATARIYRSAGRVVCEEDGELFLVDDIADTAGLVVETASTSSGPWTAVTDYDTVPENAIVQGRPITGLLRESGWSARRGRVTAKWGWPAVPDVVVEAALIQAPRLFRRKDSPEGVLGSTEWGLIRMSRVDPDVKDLLKNLTIPGLG